MSMTRIKAKPRPYQQPQLLFTSGNRIQAPNVGISEELKPLETRLPRLPAVQLVGEPLEVSGSYVKKISSDLCFAKDVVFDRCAHTLEFDDRFFDHVYNPHNAVSNLPKERKLRQPAGRYNHLGPNLHKSCLIPRQPSPAHPLPPVPQTKLASSEMDTVQSASTAKTFITEQEVEVASKKGEKLVERKTSKISQVLEEKEEEEEQEKEKEEEREREKSGVDSQKGRKSENGWDEYVMSLLSVNTARWLALELTEEDDRRNRLSDLLERWYGPPPDMMDLVPDDPKLFGDPPPLPPLDYYLPKRAEMEAERERRKWRKKTPVIKSSIEENVQTDPYGDDSSAPYYRLPAGIRRQKKQQEDELAGAINATAAEISVQRRSPTPPPTMKDYMNPLVGSKFFDTDNQYQREWLTGVQQVYVQGDDQRILMKKSNNSYKKKLQTSVPTKDLTDVTLEAEKQAKVHRKRIGLWRWRGLPEPVDDRIMGAQTEKPTSFAEAERQKRQEMENRKKIRSNNSLVKIVDEWRTRWHMNQKFADCTTEDLLRDMADMHATIRLQAVLTCAKAASFVPPPTEGIQLNNRRQDFVASLPECLLEGLEFMLDDTNEHVRKAAAIALFTLNRPLPKAEGLLRQFLEEGSAVDRWAAAQCLAHFGQSDCVVIGELVSQLMTSEDSVIHEQATHLLAILSRSTRLVHGMLAEQLNSSSWRHKIIVCKALPVLHGSINKDLSQKLGTLMWSDWHAEVRVAAAQALGKTGHGKAVHDDLRERLASGGERIRADAVQKMGFLGIMTTRLMPVFLSCFDDSYVSVRQEACIACGRLRINDRRVLDKLVYLATFDPIWRVKAHAIQALGLIGENVPPVRDCLLWAMRYETEAAVRAEAVRAVLEMEALDAEVAEILRDRHLVEASDMVAKEIERGLAILGISPSEDIDMVAQIKKEVRRLNRKERICEHIGRLENAEEHRLMRRKMIAAKPKVITAPSQPVEETSQDAEEEETSTRLASSSSKAVEELAEILEESDDEEPRTLSRSTRVTSAVTGITSPTHTERSGISPSRTERSGISLSRTERSGISLSRTGTSTHHTDGSVASSPTRTKSTEPSGLSPTPSRKSRSPSRSSAKSPHISAVGAAASFDRLSEERLAQRVEYKWSEDEEEEKAPPSSQHLYRMISSIKAMPVERGATWMSQPSDSLVDTSRLPLRDDTARHLDLISKVEGLDLGPMEEGHRATKRRESRTKSKPEIKIEKILEAGEDKGTEPGTKAVAEVVNEDDTEEGNDEGEVNGEGGAREGENDDEGKARMEAGDDELDGGKTGEEGVGLTTEAEEAKQADTEGKEVPEECGADEKEALDFANGETVEDNSGTEEAHEAGEVEKGADDNLEEVEGSKKSET